MNWHNLFHLFTAVWTCLGKEEDAYRYKCDICGKETLETIYCPY